jgi:hypothetical protein
VQIEARHMRVTRAEPDGGDLFGRLTVPGRPSAGARPERHAPLHGCRREARQRWLFVCPHVHRSALLRCRRHTPPLQQPVDPLRDAGDHLRHVVARQALSWMKSQPLAFLREHAIDHEGMHVHIQIQGAAEALNDRDGPTPAVRHTIAPRTCTQEAEDGPHVHGHHCATQIVIPREEIAELVRQAQHPLPHGSVRQDVIHEMSRAFRHPSPAARRAKAASRARERHQAIVAARVAVKAGESRREAPARQERSKLSAE